MATLLGPFQIALSRFSPAAAAPPYTAQTSRIPFAVTFEEVFASLELWPRMFIEPDGSFVWVGEERRSDGSTAAWQLDGQLYDRDERLLWVELQGTCPLSAVEQIVAACGTTLAEILVEQRCAGIVCCAAEFLKTAVVG